MGILPMSGTPVRACHCRGRCCLRKETEETANHGQDGHATQQKQQIMAKMAMLHNRNNKSWARCPCYTTKESVMFKKMMAMLVVVTMLGVLPMLSGCQDKKTVHTESTTNTPGETHTVVE
jgi:hypothetical protein